MKLNIKSILSLALLLATLFVAGCTDVERIVIQSTEESNYERTPEYYGNLRAYKESDHKIAFGWFGGWTATGLSHRSCLTSAPDSMDIISIWGANKFNLSSEQMVDMEYVQRVKSTKITYTIFGDDVPEVFLVNGEITDASLDAYAKAYASDTINKYSYDGLDIDYEPGYGHYGPLVSYNNELFKKLIIAMSKYLGPKSGTGRLLIIDGVPQAVHTELAEYFDYGIVQAYSSDGNTDLQDRFDLAYAKGWKPGQYIFTEDFEKHWSTGGTLFDEVMQSLSGMALFNPTQGASAGFGTYHMEYDYGNVPDYKYMREATQLVNPAVQP